MQLGRCPSCHCRIGLDAIVQDEAGRELLALFASLDVSVAGPLVSYMGLFRAATRDLANDRALRIAREALVLAPEAVLASALADTVEAMRAKQSQGGFKPLSNHNYLRQVVESVGARSSTALAVPPAGKAAAPRSKAGQALTTLQGMKREES